MIPATASELRKLIRTGMLAGKTERVSGLLLRTIFFIGLCMDEEKYGFMHGLSMHSIFRR